MTKNKYFRTLSELLQSDWRSEGPPFLVHCPEVTCMARISPHSHCSPMAGHIARAFRFQFCESIDYFFVLMHLILNPGIAWVIVCLSHAL